MNKEDYISLINYGVKSHTCRKELLQLVDAHFDNPALTFSDLKIGVPYWDDLRKCWLIIESYDPTFNSKEYSWYFDKNGQCYRETIYEYEFEENRYYRKEVKANE